MNVGHEYALKIEELNRELKEVKEQHYKLKGKTTTNLLKAVDLKRQMNRIETEIACQRSLYFSYLEGLRKISAFKNK